MTDSQSFHKEFKILIQKLPNDIKDNGNNRQKFCYSINFNTKTQLYVQLQLLKGLRQDTRIKWTERKRNEWKLNR